MNRKRRNLVAEYFAEEVNVGGVLLTRGRWLETMLALGHSRARVDAMLMGADRRREVRPDHCGRCDGRGYFFRDLEGETVELCDCAAVEATPAEEDAAELVAA